jgi:hypothetical protein
MAARRILAVLVALVVRLDGRRGAALHRLFERAVRIVHLERDVADAVAVQFQVVRRGVIRNQRRREDEPGAALPHHVGGHVTAAGLEARVRELREAEGVAVEVGRLPGVADPELHMVDLAQFERIVLHIQSITPTHDHLPLQLSIGTAELKSGPMSAGWLDCVRNCDEQA